MLLRQVLAEERAAAVDVLPATPTREQIDLAEQWLLDHEYLIGVEIQVRHYFTPGLYAREVFIPARAVLTGAEHKTRHLVTFSGDITVWHEGQMVRLTGYHTLESSPGVKRVGLAHADTYCIGFFPNPDECRDIAELERRLVLNPEMLQNNRKPVLPFGPAGDKEIECSESQPQ